MASDFVKRLDDIVRQELLIMGYDYGKLIAGIEESPGSEGAVIRFHPPYEDIFFEPAASDMPEDTFAARVRRRLKMTIDAPERPAPSESF